MKGEVTDLVESKLVDEYIKQQCNYCGHKSEIYAELILYVDPYGDVASNYICLDCYTKRKLEQ